MKKAVVIIPTYNERENIERTLKAVIAQAPACAGWKVEMLVVDDTSPDKTYEVVTDFSKNHPEVNLLINGKKSGLGGAYLKGMEEAFIRMKADVVFEFDADLSHDPTKIPAFLQVIDAGADMVLGTRYKKGGSIPKDWGFHRKFLSVMGNITIMLVLGTLKYRDWTSGYRCISKKVYQAVVPLLQSEQFTGYTFQIGFLYYAQKLGFDVREAVPYHFVDREIGHSKIGPEYMKNTLEFIFKTRLNELKNSKVIKFALVGGVGAMVQLLSLRVLLSLFSLEGFMYELLYFVSIELAIISNFILNNAWTFADSKLTPSQIPKKFLTFNLSSFGSIIIQMIVAFFGHLLIGFHDIISLPIVGVINTQLVFAVVGILLGMVWNFFAYTKFVWNTGPKHAKQTT